MSFKTTSSELDHVPKKGHHQEGGGTSRCQDPDSGVKEGDVTEMVVGGEIKVV